MIERAMRRDPAERYASAEAMAAALLGEDPGTDAAVTMPIAAPPEPVADAQPDGSETVRMPAMEQTARLPVQPPAARSAASRRPRRAALIVAGAIVVVALLVVLAFSAFTGRNTPGSGAANSTTLPAGLESALDELEESVQP